jgi:hypothetical protein
VIRQLQLRGKPHQRPVVVKATTETAAPATESDNTESDSISAVTSAVTDPVASESVASDSNVGATSESNEGVPATNAVASDSNVPAPTTDPVTPVSTVVQPATTAVTTVVSAALSVPAVIASLPTSPTPVVDVITMIQNVLISVNEAIALLAQVPSDLYALLVVPGMDITAVNSVAASSAAMLRAEADAALVPPMAPLPPPLLPISPIGGMPFLGDVTAHATLGAGSSADLSISGTAAPAVEGVRPMDALSLLEHAVRAVLAPASLSALAAFALPGVGGLLIICAAGMRVGYRQATAALTVRTTGISRFAPRGPLGVVHSGSLIALHPRTLRVERPEVSPVAGLLERAA